MADFKLFRLEWSTQRQAFETQIDTLSRQIQTHAFDVIVICGIPRHHAKKLQNQSDWTKDYYVSKEARAVTTKSRSNPQPESTTTTTTRDPTKISVIFTKYPTATEQWFALENDVGFAHVVDICIPLNAWIPSHCPLALLQEYQLTYDEVSTITVVVTTSMTPELKKTFDEIENTVITIFDGKIEKRLHYWRSSTENEKGNDSSVALVSCVEN